MNTYEAAGAQFRAECVTERAGLAIRRGLLVVPGGLAVYVQLPGDRQRRDGRLSFKYNATLRIKYI